jgi:hypothetical protein
MREGKFFLQTVVPSLAQPVASISIKAQSYQSLGKVFFVPILDQLSRDVMHDNFWCAAAIGGDSRFAVLHRLKINKTKSFLGAWHHKNIAGPVTIKEDCFVNGP